MRKVISAVAVSVLLAACGEQVPADKANYVGEWHNKNTYLQISQEGQIVYRRAEGNTKTSLNVPLKHFTGDSFEAGLGPMSTMFKVTKPPHQVGDHWMMVVDGAELVNTGACDACEDIAK